MPNYYQHNGTSYVHVSDYAAIEARLAEEVKNKKEFERDWLAACDELCNTRSRLAEAEALLREWCACATNSGSGEAIAKVEQQFVQRCRDTLLRLADSAAHREDGSHE